MNPIDAETALTFDDVLLLPGPSHVLPSQTSLKTHLCRGITLNIPVLSAAMDTVTESTMAIALAQFGGMGVIHKNLSIEEQATKVRQVKRAESGVIVDPITLDIGATVADAFSLAERTGVSGFPVVSGGRLAGMLTHRDYQFEEDGSKPVSELMTPLVNLITAPEKTGVENALLLLRKHRLEKLPLVDGEGRVVALITVKDIIKAQCHPDANKDSRGSLRVAAAVSVGDPALDRAAALVEAGVDCLFIDSAHGHNSGVLDTTRRIRSAHSTIPICSGNVVTAEGTIALLDAGADMVKVGVGPGSICTTRIVAGVGCPQITAVHQCSRAALERNATIIADGGIKYSGDIVKALAAGACSVMIGSLFAGVAESPGEAITYKGRRFKSYRGMGSLGAMQLGSADRYFQKEDKKLVPEGIEGMVPFKGPLSDFLHQLMGGLRAGMGYVGAAEVSELRTKGRFVRITSAGLKESHAHDVMITKEAPNYTLESHAF